MHPREVLMWFLSPTLALAKIEKERADWMTVIGSLNTLYLRLAILQVAVFALMEYWMENDLMVPSFSALILGYYIWSRAYEILIAFIRDALDKTKPRKKPQSNLPPNKRIELALKSYLELILIFGVAYWLMPQEWWKEPNGPQSIWEAVYYSGVTITTLGYGDITPKFFVAQIFSVFEVLCGFSLLVVSFAIYVGLPWPEPPESNEP